MANYVIGVLWFLPIAFMFYCQHHVCEEYFIPAINCLVDKAKSSPNPWMQRWGDSAVAGATIMALGCNGPELFCNLISLYIGSDAGIGVVVGSEIFNLLIIIGCSVLFCPTMPLVLEKASFIRDCFFYALSIVLLVWALELNSPNKIEPFEAVVLLIAEVLFVLCVYFTADIEAKITGGGAAAGAMSQPLVVDPEKNPNAKIHGVECKVKQLFGGTMQAKTEYEDMRLDATAIGIKDTEGEQPSQARVSSTGKRASVGFAVEGGGYMKYADLREVTIFSEGKFHMEFHANAIEQVTLEVLVPSGSVDRDLLLDNIMKFSAKKPFKHTYDPSIFGAIEHFKHAIKQGTTGERVLACVEMLADSMLKPTLFWCDVKDHRKEGMWVVCFIGAMCWLAVYSFLMLEVATQINMCIPQLSMAFLGVTLCAVGTSFPNAIASILMSKQDKSAAAIANALGSNVQNVFLAMAMPWIIFMATPTSLSPYIIAKSEWSGPTGRDQWTPVPQEPPKKGQSVTEGVYWMCGTLILVIVMACMPQVCTFSKPYGIFLCFVYVVYLVWTSYEALAPSPAPAVTASATSLLFF